MVEKISVGLIGAGAMGAALLRGWLRAGSIDPNTSAIFDPAAPDEIAALCDEHRLPLNPPIAGTSVGALVIAVKPQVAGDVLPTYSALGQNAIVISVMAGQSVENISTALGGAPRIARAMPNLPAAIGKGVSGLFANAEIGGGGRRLVETLMAAAGETVWVGDESEIDAVTAVSGSGPAYFFLLTEALAEAGEAEGLSREAARALARATLAGAGALIDIDARAPEEIRRAVTSPGGTTEAALNVFDGEEQPLRKLVRRAVNAAAVRGRQLTS